MWIGFAKMEHQVGCECAACSVSKDDMTDSDLDTGGRLQPDQAPKFKRKKPPIPTEA